MYNRRTWLNKEGSASTGNVVAFEGETLWGSETVHSIILSISDCHVSARLHKSADDSLSDFTDKMILLRNEIDLFIKHLETLDKIGTKNSNTNSNPDEFTLAIEYLKSRAVRFDKVSKQLLKQFVEILPVSEVESVIKMAQSGDFTTFYNDLKKLDKDETDQNGGL